MDQSQRQPVMLDPSFLFSAGGVEWIGDEAMRQNLVVPSSVGPWLRGELDWPTEHLVSSDDLELFADRRRWMVERLEGVPVFSIESVHLSLPARLVLNSLIEEDQLGLLRAEEWAFLLSHSVLISKLRHPVDAFRDAGAYIIEVGRKVGHKLLEEVLPKERIDDELGAKLIGLGVAKWVIVGGAHLGAGTLGGLVGAIAGGPVGGLLAGVPASMAGEKLASAALLAIDP
jgi:hypothetical protein